MQKTRWEGNDMSTSSVAEVLLSVPHKSPSNWEQAGRLEGEKRCRFLSFLYATTFPRMFYSSEMFPSYPDRRAAQMANRSFRKAELKQPHTCTQAQYRNSSCSKHRDDVHVIRDTCPGFSPPSYSPPRNPGLEILSQPSSHWTLPKVCTEINVTHPEIFMHPQHK